jgi:hypothetical protein
MIIGRKVVQDKSVFGFTLHLVSEIFRILGKIKRDNVINVQAYSRKAHVLIVRL